jgi:hypothetical protein
VIPGNWSTHIAYFHYSFINKLKQERFSYSHLQKNLRINGLAAIAAPTFSCRTTPPLPTEMPRARCHLASARAWHECGVEAEMGNAARETSNSVELSIRRRVLTGLERLPAIRIIVDHLGKEGMAPHADNSCFRLSQHARGEEGCGKYCRRKDKAEIP